MIDGKILYVEGNIGAGKTTFLETLAVNTPNYQVSIVKEPITEWVSTPVGNVLAAATSSATNELATAFQVLVMSSLRRQRSVPAPAGVIRLEERSITTAHEVFQPALLKEGVLSHQAAYCLTYAYTELKAGMPKSDGMIYIREDPDVVFGRVKARATEADKFVTRDYLHTLHTFYEEYVVSTDLPVMTLTGEEVRGLSHTDILAPWTTKGC